MAKEFENQPEGQQNMLPPTKVGKYETGVDLPSFGMSNFVDMANSEEVKRLLKTVNFPKSSHVKLPGPVPISPAVTTQSTCPETSNQYVLVKGTGNNPTLSPVLPAEESLQATGQEEADVVICVGPNEGYQDNIYDPLFPFTAGRTEPLGACSTVDTSQLGIGQITEISDDNALFGEGAENMMTEEMASLNVKVNNYSRFRYQSERNTGNKRPRQYDMDEDKRCLAEIELKNYNGRARVIAHCVNRNGKLHPYSLYGNNCHHGVFVQMVDVTRKSKSVLKLLKVSITTPKAKEYGNSIAEQQRYLEQMQVLSDQDIPPKSGDHGDKQVVYLKVKVVLEDNKGIILEQISTEIRNKKEGTEFKIRSVIPSWAPVSGPCQGNPDKTKVIVIVTDNTAFPNPKDVCIVLRKKLADGKLWMRALEENNIEVIRKTVVEFTPPAFRSPDTVEDVEVDLVLKDKKTGQETEPVTFTYKGIDEYGVMGKGKKRKLDTLSQDLTFNTGGYPVQERKTLQALRKRGAQEMESGSHSSSSSPDNSLIQEQIPMAVSSQGGGSVADTEISIGGMRQNRALVAGSHATPPVTTTAPAYPSAPPTPQQAPSVANYPITPQPIFSTAGSNSGPQTQGAASSAPGSQPSVDIGELLRQIVAGTNFPAQNQGADQMSTPQQSEVASLTSQDLVAMILQLQQQQKTAPPAYIQLQPNPAPAQPSVAPAVMQPPATPVLTKPPMPPQTVIDPNVKLPKLKSNQMLAVLNGQIVIINDDTVEASSDNMDVQATGSSNVQQQQSVASGNTYMQIPMATQAGLQYQLPGNLAQTPQYTIAQGNQMVPGQLGYQQNPVPARNQPIYTQQGQNPSVPWYQFGNALDDDDLEIDSGSYTTKGNEKNVKRHKNDTVELVSTNNNKVDSSNSFLNLPKVIADVSDESEEDGEKQTKIFVVDSEGRETVVYVTGLPEADNDNMQS